MFLELTPGQVFVFSTVAIILLSVADTLCFSCVQQKAREEREAKRSMIDPRHEHIINTVAESLALSTEEVTESLLEGNQVQLMVEVQSLNLLFGYPGPRGFLLL